MLTKKVPKSSKNYECTLCAYKTVRKSQFDRHLLTAKHHQLTSLTEKVPKAVSYVNIVIKSISLVWDYGNINNYAVMKLTCNQP